MKKPKSTQEKLDETEQRTNKQSSKNKQGTQIQQETITITSLMKTSYPNISPPKTPKHNHQYENIVHIIHKDSLARHFLGLACTSFIQQVR